MRIYEPAGDGFYWEGDEYANARYTYDPKARAVVPLNDRTIMRQVSEIDGKRLVPVVFFGPGVKLADIKLPDDCVIVREDLDSSGTSV